MMTYITSAVDRMQISNLNQASKGLPQAAVRADSACHHAWWFMEAGKKDTVSGLQEKWTTLQTHSWVWHKDGKELTSILCLHFPQQMPTHFKTSLILNKISSWLILLLHRLPMNVWLQEKHMMTRLELEHNGTSTASQSDVETSSWTASASKNESSCSEHLPWLSEVVDSPIYTLTQGTLKAQSEVPSQMWCRPSGHWGDRIPQKMQTKSLASSYWDSSKHSETKTLKNSKRPFHSQCSIN